MNKARIVIGLAAATALLFASCAKTMDANASLETGTLNYDFTGKTFVNTYTSSYTKRVTIDVTDSSTGKTTSTVTESSIPFQTITTTLVFAADNTITESQAFTYLAGIDGDYRTTSSSSISGTITTTTTTEYRNNNTPLDAYTVGRAGITTYSDSYSGTWKPYSLQAGATDGETLNYIVAYDSDTTVTNLTNFSTETVAAVTGSASTTKTTYTQGSNTTEKTNVDPTETIDVTYSPQGTTTVAGAEKDLITISFERIGNAKKAKFDAYEFTMDFIVQ